jgi:deoxyadenosine/deoxycytidine kinase
MHIAITGNIGAGKTTLSGILAKHYGWNVLYEAVEGNPYLEPFYSDMKRWAFQLQMFFLKSRFNQILEIKNSSETYIQDRTVYEDAFIFAKNLCESDLLTETDYQTYKGFFELLTGLVSPPDLLIYLKADLPKLKTQIAKRGRSFEANIDDTYLQNLNKLYEEFVSGFSDCPLLVIDANNIDFVNTPKDLDYITEKIDRILDIKKETAQ